MQDGKTPYITVFFTDGSNRSFNTRGEAADFFGVAGETVTAWLSGERNPRAKHGIERIERNNIDRCIGAVEVVFNDGKIDEYPSFIKAAEGLGITPQELNNYKRVRGLGVLSVHKIKEN